MQLALFHKDPDWVQSRILELDPDTMTPLSALQTLHSLKEEILRKNGGPSGEKGRRTALSRKDRQPLG